MIWSKEFLEAGKQRLVGDTKREADSQEVEAMRSENEQLKLVVAELMLKNRNLTPALAGGAREKSLLGSQVGRMIRFMNADIDTIWVVTGEPLTREDSIKQLRVEELSVNVNLFLEQLNTILERTPEKLGKFQFVEFELYAEVTAKGTLAIIDTGGAAGATSGLKFVFRRLPLPQNSEQ